MTASLDALREQIATQREVARDLRTHEVLDAWERRITRDLAELRALREQLRSFAG